MPASGFDAQEAGELMILALRSLLFVPGDDKRKVAKALTSEADAIILDLEDAVAPRNKEAARSLVAETLDHRSGRKLFVRINGFSSGHADADLEAVLTHRPDGLVLPKCKSGNDVLQLAALAGPLLPVIAIATETAASLLVMDSYATAGPSLLGLAWGGEDLSVDLGAAANRDAEGRYTEPYRLARSLCLIGARAAGVEPIDAVYTSYRDLGGLEHEARVAARDGFSAKLAIHPDQIPIINEVFTPSEQELNKARRIVAAFAESGNRGVIGLDGEMLDVPHLRRAERLIARAGIEVE
jgi:citrate lyase subunit beta/citryl-CoA lyase